ncbi:MAG: pyridoxamine 5'-phosphate oxidase [Verrucomicrobia bacterium]|jgi:pyridoxamine 5'-phosphate oxidase|nr:MAG: pyridoxamine 5'-phosphate oxidase [Verrucomicrobiota bacterium]
MRQDYTRHQLLESEVAGDPFAQFHGWFDEARRHGIREPNAMVLSTVNPAGGVSSRTVLLKGLDDRGFQFFTNRDSRKGEQLRAEPRAAVTFLWAELERQVNIEGTVEWVSEAESDAYFLVRPHSAQIGAWVSLQSQVIPDREWLERRLEEFQEKYSEPGSVPRPPQWGGYRLVPMRMEFWQGRPSRLHDRLVFMRAGEGEAWRVERLSP